MDYISTRGNYDAVRAASAIRLGMVPRGGLFLPDHIPPLDVGEVLDCDYTQLAARVLGLYLEDYSANELDEFSRLAYGRDSFPPQEVVPLRMLDEGCGVLELFHGPTAAFKDLALQMLPHLLTAAVRKQASEREVVILVATSGDTGKAALEGFRDVPGTRIIVFYPKHGVSHIQELQMVTTAGDNTHVVAVEGNFDDCQTMVKDIFADTVFSEELHRAGMEFSSANSINWGRLVPQIVYYYWAYLSLIRNKSLQAGDPFLVVVPTGNFGNILAAYYARCMGLPIARLVCASNRNKVLTDFFQDGVYDRQRDFYLTASPAMDILISSNLERFLFAMGGHDPHKADHWYQQLSQEGRFQVDAATRQAIDQVLEGDFADETETFAEIRHTFEEYGYLIDPHTAVGMRVFRRYRERTKPAMPTVVDATASPFKFNTAVYQALTGEQDSDEFQVLGKLEQLAGQPVHRALRGLADLPVRHDRLIKISDGRAAIRSILGLG